MSELAECTICGADTIRCASGLCSECESGPKELKRAIDVLETHVENAKSNENALHEGCGAFYLGARCILCKEEQWGYAWMCGDDLLCYKCAVVKLLTLVELGKVPNMEELMSADGWKFGPVEHCQC